MAELQWTIEGRRFRSQEEYMAALRDKELIDSITSNLNLDDPKDIEKLYMELKNGKYEFESVVGRQFDDNVYELYERIRQERQRKEEEKKQKEEKRKARKQVKMMGKVKTKRRSKTLGQAKTVEQVQTVGQAKTMGQVQTMGQAKMVRQAKTVGQVQTVGQTQTMKQAKQSKIKLDDFDPAMQEEILRVLRKKERKRKCMIAACAVICLVCFGYVGAYYQVSAKSAKEFEELLALKEAGATGRAAKSGAKIHFTEDNVVIPDILPEYEKIYNKNKKLIGWIKIDDTIIDYPVMQTVNNEYYLDHNFNQEEDRNGCIFMDYQCDILRGCDNIILYGHHMKSGKMFGSLNKYSKESYYQEHQTILFDTIYEKGEYQVMYVFRSKVYSEEDVTFKYYQFINAASEKEFNSYIHEMSALSLYDTGVTASYGDQLLTLSTCDYQEKKGRFVVVAKKIS